MGEYKCVGTIATNVNHFCTMDLERAVGFIRYLFRGMNIDDDADHWRTYNVTLTSDGVYYTVEWDYKDDLADATPMWLSTDDIDSYATEIFDIKVEYKEKYKTAEEE